jgi:hypothetical protein
MDFDHIIFPTGSVFIFGSWVYEADDEGNLQGCLIEAQDAHEELTFPMGLAKDLAKGFSGLMVSESTRAPMTTRFDLISDSNSFLGSNPGSSRDKMSFFQLDSGTRHQPSKRSIRAYFKALSGSWVTSQLDSMMWRELIKTCSEK